MSVARKSLAGKWGIAIGGLIFYNILTYGLGLLLKLPVTFITSDVRVIDVCGGLLYLLIVGPTTYGLVSYFLSLVRGGFPDLSALISGFKAFWRYSFAGLSICFFVFLWSLLLIIPGIMALYAYALTYYIMHDDQHISIRDALAKSRKMMYGKRWKLFRLGLRFFGYALLSLFTLGIGLLWVIPYALASNAAFYEDVKRHG